MSSPIDAVVHHDTAYFRAHRSRRIYSYNLTRGWSICADCLVRDTSLIILPVNYDGAVYFHLHTIGGIKPEEHRQSPDDEYTGAIYHYLLTHCAVAPGLLWRSSNTEQSQVTTVLNEKFLIVDPGLWNSSSDYPTLNTKRSQVTTVLSDKSLIVAGGQNKLGPVNTVEVLTIRSTCQDEVSWHEVASLPYPVYRASGCVCNGMLYIIGGYVVNKDGDNVPTRNACVATVSQLRTNDRDIFRKIQNLKFKTSACVSFRNHVLAIGGYDRATDQPKGTNLVYVYDTDENVWKELNDKLSRPQCFGFAVVFEDKIMTVGGYDRPDGTCTDSVEFAIIVV